MEDPKQLDGENPNSNDAPKLDETPVNLAQTYGSDVAVFSAYVHSHGDGWAKVFAEEKNVEILITDPHACEALPVGKRLLITISEIEE